MKVKKRTRKQKLHLIFDEEERKDFLLGFRKRKEARKLKAKEELAIALKEEKKRLKIEQKESLKNMLLTQRGVPEVEHLLEPTVYDLPDHTVTISEIPSLDLPSVSTTVGNSLAIEENQPSLDENSEVGGKDVMKKIKEQRLKAIKSSSTFNISKTLQKKKDKKEAKKKKRLLKQNVKRTKKNRQKKNKRK